MAITYAVDRSGMTADPALSVTLTGVERTEFAMVSSSVAENRISASYVNTKSNMDYPVTLSVSSIYDPKGLSGHGITRNSLRYGAYEKISDSVAGTDSYFPVEVVIAWNVPGKTIHDELGLLKMMNDLFSFFFYHNGTAWINAGNPIVKLNYGAPDIFTGEFVAALT